MYLVNELLLWRLLTLLCLRCRGLGRLPEADPGINFELLSFNNFCCFTAELKSSGKAVLLLLTVQRWRARLILLSTRRCRTSDLGLEGLNSEFQSHRYQLWRTFCTCALIGLVYCTWAQ